MVDKVAKNAPKEATWHPWVHPPRTNVSISEISGNLRDPSEDEYGHRRNPHVGTVDVDDERGDAVARFNVVQDEIPDLNFYFVGRRVGRIGHVDNDDSRCERDEDGVWRVRRHVL